MVCDSHGYAIKDPETSALLLLALGKPAAKSGGYSSIPAPGEVHLEGNRGLLPTATIKEDPPLSLHSKL
jgi:hypothetical protein